MINDDHIYSGMLLQAWTNKPPVSRISGGTVMKARCWRWAPMHQECHFQMMWQFWSIFWVSLITLKFGSTCSWLEDFSMPRDGGWGEGSNMERNYAVQGKEMCRLAFPIMYLLSIISEVVLSSNSVPLERFVLDPTGASQVCAFWGSTVVVVAAGSMLLTKTVQSRGSNVIKTGHAGTADCKSLSVQGRWKSERKSRKHGGGVKTRHGQVKFPPPPSLLWLNRMLADKLMGKLAIWMLLIDSRPEVLKVVIHLLILHVLL